jgi:TRAP-type transport system small permease protein
MNTISRWIQIFEEAFLTLSVLSSVGISVVGVFFRYVIGSSLSYVEELAGLLLLSVISVGIGAGARQGSHLRADIIPTFLPQTKKGLNIVANLIALGVMIILTIYAIGFVADVLMTDQRTTSLHWLPLGLPLLIMPVAYLTGLFRFTESLLNLFKNDNEPKKKVD